MSVFYYQERIDYKNRGQNEELIMNVKAIILVYGNNKLIVLGTTDRFAGLMSSMVKSAQHEIDSCKSFNDSWI